MLLRKFRLWQAQHPALNSILIGLALGVVVELIFSTALHDSRITRAVDDWIFDSTTSLAERTQSTLGDEVPFVLVDIDQPTSAAWGFPLITPRDHLAELLQRVAAARPAVVVLDIDLAWPDVASNNDRFVRFLQSYPPDAPMLVIATSLKPGSGAFPTVRDTPFDTVIADHPNIRQGTVQFTGDGDRMTRRWRLYERLCVDGVPAVLPAIALAAAAALDSSSQRSLTATLRELVPTHCEATPHADHLIAQTPRDVTLTDARNERRMIYSIRWRPGDTFLGPWVGFDGKQVRLVTVRSAKAVMAAEAASEPQAILAGRIVVVASSFGQTEEYHLTPLGTMPGGLVVINAIHSLLHRGSPAEPHFAVKALISGGLIVANALAFCFLRLFWAVVVTCTLILGLAIMTVGWFQSGTVLDLAVPSIGVLMHRAFVVLEDAYHVIRRQGWRFFVRDRHHPPTRRKKLRTPPAASLVIALAIVLAPAAVLAEGVPVEVGLVETYEAPSTQYGIRRGAMELPVVLADPILNGDIIAVKTPKGRIELRLLGERHNVIVSRQNSPYEVKVKVPSPGFSSGLYGWFASAIDAVFAKQHEEDAYPAVGRGEDKLDVRLLATTQKIAAGKRALTLGWIGGNRPVRVRLFREGSNALLADARAVRVPWTVPAIEFSVGRYRVEMVDARGAHATGIIEVVDQTSLPDYPRLPTAAPGALNATVAAAWLSNQGNGAYVLESFQMIAGPSERFHPARVLARALVEGQKIGD